MSSHMEEEMCCDEDITPEVKTLIEVLKDINFGEITIVVKNGKPYMGKHVRQDLKFTK